MKLKTKELSGEIATSPMADIAFLLVIYFMISATFATTKGLDLALPEEEETQEIQFVESVLVEVRGDGSLEVDRKPLARENLLRYLEPKLQQNPRKPVLVRTLPEAPYGATVRVLDTLRQGREILHLAEDIRIQLPTEREVSAYGY